MFVCWRTSRGEEQNNEEKRKRRCRSTRRILIASKNHDRIGARVYRRSLASSAAKSFQSLFDSAHNAGQIVLFQATSINRTLNMPVFQASPRRWPGVQTPYSGECGANEVIFIHLLLRASNSRFITDKLAFWRRGWVHHPAYARCC